MIQIFTNFALAYPHDSPGKLGIVGRPPQAIRMCLALYTLSPTLTFPSGVNTAWPTTYSTLSFEINVQ